MSIEVGGLHSLDGVVRENVTLPMPVFCEEFETYVFFDLDVATSSELAAGITKLIVTRFQQEEPVEVFATTSRSHLGTVPGGQALQDSLPALGQSLRDDGECGGLIVLPASKKWMVFQHQPIDIGVLALSKGAALPRSLLEAEGCFFDCGDIAEWLQGKTERDVSLREDLGTRFLGELLANYCSS